MHPNKLDVRFSNNQVIYGAVYSIVSKTLDGAREALDIIIDKNQSMPIETNVNYVRHNGINSNAESRFIEKKDNNAVNIIPSTQEHIYCELKVTESPIDDWYENDTLHVNLKVPDGYNIVDYGIGYSANNYQLTYNMTIPKSKTGAFNLYGYVKDDKGNTANCIRLIKKQS